MASGTHGQRLRAVSEVGVRNFLVKPHFYYNYQKSAIIHTMNRERTINYQTDEVKTAASTNGEGNF